MKKITFLMAFLALLNWQANAQILNQSANWPDTNWIVGGAYAPMGLVNNPTVTSNFTFDDDAAGSGSTDTIFAESPVIDLAAAKAGGETWVFINGDFVYRALGGDLLTIDYWDADAASWVTIKTFVGNTTTTADYQGCLNMVAYTTTELNIAGFTPAQLSGFKYRISYNDNLGWQWGWCVGSPTIVSSIPPSCIDPSILTATTITSTSANLGWTENGTATTWNIEWDTTGFTPGTGTMVTGTTNNPEPVTGLAPETTYQFYVQADCGGSGTSAWAGPFSFTTPCAASAISSFPWTENFDGVTAPAIPCGWMVDNVNADAYTWVTGTTAASAPNSMQVRWNASEAANDWSFTPELVLVGGTTYELSFAFAVAGATFPEKLKVMYGTAQNVAGMSDLLFDSTLTNTIFDTAYTTFTPTISGSYYIGFHNYSDADMFRIYVDEVTLKETVADTCSIPSNLTAFNITQTSAMLDWTENGTATEWDIEWGFQGFTLGTGTPVHVVSKPYLLNGLTPTTAYEYYVRADCGNGDTSLWVGPFMFVTEPCPFVIIDLGNDTTLCSDQSITLNAPFNPNWGYSWSPVGSGGSSNTLDTVVLGGNGTYNVMLNVIDFTNGCMYFDAINVTFSICTGVNENVASNFTIYPNPTNGWITVKIAANDKGAIEVTNLQGKVIYKNTLNSNTQNIDLSANAKGVYFVTVTTKNGVEIQKMTIQ